MGQNPRGFITKHPPANRPAPAVPEAGFGMSCTPQRSSQLGWGKAELVLGAGWVPGPGGSSLTPNPRSLQGCAGAGTFCPCRDGHELHVSPSPLLAPFPDPAPGDNSLEQRPWPPCGDQASSRMGRAEGERSNPPGGCRKGLQSQELWGEGPSPLQSHGGQQEGSQHPSSHSRGVPQLWYPRAKRKRGRSRGGGDDVSVPPVRSRFCRVVWEAFSDAEGQEL